MAAVTQRLFWRRALTNKLALLLSGAAALLLVAIVASSTVLAYSVYTLTARDSKALLATVPFVIFGVFRYLLLVHRDDVGEEPEQVLLTDVPIILAVAGWIVSAAAILVLT